MKERLDKLLVTGGYFDTREKAKKAIMAGTVFVNGQLKDKAGDQVDENAEILVKGAEFPYVSRGGLKLEKGLAVFMMPVEGKVFVDVGASTGGFTDCLLINGADKVYAVDVGYGQLDWKLRNDHRVISMERTNFRHLTEEAIPEKADGTVMDVSFISITKLLPALKMVMKPDGLGIWLIKPQFEAGRDKVGKKGVIRDKKIHEEVVNHVLSAIEAAGITVLNLDYSPIQGAKGNIEFLVYIKNCENSELPDWGSKVREIVEAAHKQYRDPENN
ncbi:TlyA family RNA methyltransferase [Eubacteriaceae bacterium ES3]|nr:TlyA family RNA methyltransferase [Eubacteriaceae bacterium ES3]